MLSVRTYVQLINPTFSLPQNLYLAVGCRAARNRFRVVAWENLFDGVNPNVTVDGDAPGNSLVMTLRSPFISDYSEYVCVLFVCVCARVRVYARVCVRVCVCVCANMCAHAVHRRVSVIGLQCPNLVLSAFCHLA